MADLEFVDQHNMVACLEKTPGNSEFHEIVDFLTSSLIHHALTISPTIYISYIEQFWNTASSQTVNDEKQIHATVDSKAVVVTEASIRSSLFLNDVDVEEGEGSEQPTEPQPTPSPTQPSVGDQPHVTESSSGPANTHSPNMNLEGTGGNTGDRVQLSNDILIQVSVKRLSMKNKLGKKETVSKQGRKSAKPKPTLDAFDDLDADLAHGMDYMDSEEAVTEGRQSKETEEQNVGVNAAGNIGVSTAFNISTASRPEVSTATPMTHPTTTSVFEDEDIFLSDALVMLSDKAKLKGVEIKEKKDVERPAISVLTLKPLLKIDPKDKGKGVLEEEPEPVKVKSKDQGEAQIKIDAKIAKQLQEEYDKSGKKEAAAEVDTTHVIDWNDPTVIRYHALQNRPRSVAEVGKNMLLRDQVHSFVPIDSEEEVQRLKRAGQDVEAKPAKRQRIEEVSKSVQEQTNKEPKIDELSQEQLNQIVIIVPDEGINVEALQTKYPIIGWKVYSEDIMQFWKIIRVGNHTEVYQVFEDMLKNFDRDDLVKLWSLIQERYNSSGLTEDKEIELWVELKMTKLSTARPKLSTDSTRIERMKLEAMVKERRIFKCWFHYHTTNGHQFTMSNRHQELASPEQTASALAIPKQTATGKEISNPFMAGSLPKTTRPT
ncbi:hypothetical protein Tco_0975948 [Tanacetum coccineum]|uniref:Xylulose kinase-1 n=1 Tax=Tanacetum coccineum TaxID=301880 RepID=A0ABQ5EFV8_9ASTR